MADDSINIWLLTEPHSLDRLKFFARKLVMNITRVQCRGGLEQKHLALFFGEGPVFKAPRNDNELARFNPLGTLAAVLAIVHAKPATDDQKHFILGFVMMPGERPLEFHQLN